MYACLLYSESFVSQLYREDIAFTDLDGFRNNVNNANGIPDIQDGNYGLMLSELLGNESPNSSVPTGLTSLHDHVVHSSGEVIQSMSADFSSELRLN